VWYKIASTNISKEVRLNDTIPKAHTATYLKLKSVALELTSQMNSLRGLSGKESQYLSDMIREECERRWKEAVYDAVRNNPANEVRAAIVRLRAKRLLEFQKKLSFEESRKVA
jgi:hypothetical protein